MERGFCRAVQEFAGRSMRFPLLWSRGKNPQHPWQSHFTAVCYTRHLSTWAPASEMLMSFKCESISRHFWSYPWKRLLHLSACKIRQVSDEYKKNDRFYENNVPTIPGYWADEKIYHVVQFEIGRETRSKIIVMRQ